MRHLRQPVDIKVADAVTFAAGDQVPTEQAFAGDKWPTQSRHDSNW